MDIINLLNKSCLSAYEYTIKDICTSLECRCNSCKAIVRENIDNLLYRQDICDSCKNFIRNQQIIFANIEQIRAHLSDMSWVCDDCRNGCCISNKDVMEKLQSLEKTIQELILRNQ